MDYEPHCRRGAQKGRELVIQGSHMVSGTQCPAGSDPVEIWSRSRAGAPKGRCPVEHRGEFRDVCPSVHPDGWRAELRLGEQI